MFRLAEAWERSDVEIRQRPWDAEEIEPMLQRAGFEDIHVFRAIQDLHMSGHYCIDRVYVCARRGTQ